MIAVGVAGGSGSGKSTFVRSLKDKLGANRAVVVQQDAYYRDQSHLVLEERKQLNFDHPNAIEWELMANHIELLKLQSAVQMPSYSMLTCTRGNETIEVAPAEIVLVEGILIYTSGVLREMLDVKVFLEVDETHRYERVLRRDMQERGRSELEVQERFTETVEPMHMQFIEPSRVHADILVPGGGMNQHAINLVSGMVNSIRKSK